MGVGKTIRYIGIGSNMSHWGIPQVRSLGIHQPTVSKGLAQLSATHFVSLLTLVSWLTVGGALAFSLYRETTPNT